MRLLLVVRAVVDQGNGEKSAITHEKGHTARYCPKAKERSNSSNVAMLTTEVLESLSVEQLEQILAKSKL